MKFSSLTMALLVACSNSSPLQAQSPHEVFTPQAGFDGSSEGNGTLTLFFGRQRPFHVVSHGHQASDGTFRLDQTITFQGHAPQDRSWVLTTVSGNDYSGTLSGVAGIVTGHTEGNLLMLHYRVKGPLVMHQTLKLMADGKTIDNVGTITLLGIPVGHLHETIDRKHSP
ncbi:MAG: DUF3833 family protein [Dokdonella sp.]